MKKLVILFGALAATTAGAFSLLCCVWEDTSKPPLPLPEAYAFATSALGEATNQFHCVSAKASRSWAPQGDWIFLFANTNGNYKTVFVAMSHYGFCDDQVTTYQEPQIGITDGIANGAK